MSRQTVTTTVREYDDEGRVVKETVTTSEYEWAETPSLPSVPVSPYVQPWYYPTTTTRGYTAGTVTNVPPYPYTINTCGPAGTWTVINGTDGDDGEAVSA